MRLVKTTVSGGQTKRKLNFGELMRRLEQLKVETNLEIIHLSIQSMLDELEEAQQGGK